ncbi:hypothetical protein SH449x_004087 [Pirellulaceae bacterium SH449]
MDRQARVVMFGVTDPDEVIPLGGWESHGNVCFWEAVRRTALNQTPAHRDPVLVNVETRDADDPSIPPCVVKVEVSRDTRILNPRRGTDRPEVPSLLSTAWNMVRELVG